MRPVRTPNTCSAVTVTGTLAATDQSSERADTIPSGPGSSCRTMELYSLTTDQIARSSPRPLRHSRTFGSRRSEPPEACSAPGEVR